MVDQLESQLDKEVNDQDHQETPLVERFQLENNNDVNTATLKLDQEESLINIEN